MSTHMMPNRTLSIIATYLAECANTYGRDLWRIEADTDFIEFLKSKGLADPDSGKVSPRLLHRYLCECNRNAVAYAYGEEGAKELCPAKPKEYEAVKIDIRPWERRIWLANLYTVVRCYCYQIDEGDVNKEFVGHLRRWRWVLAEELADVTVKHVRGTDKSWEEF